MLRRIVVDEVRVLRAGDEELLFSFLVSHVESSLFLISNVERAGLDDRGLPLQGTYVAHFSQDRITAVAAHCWNGNILVQGDAGLELAAERAVRETGRPIRGIVGPLALTRRVRRALGLEQRRAAHEAPETLFTLELDALVEPPPFGDSQLVCRHPTESEVRDTLIRWRIAYLVEAVGSADTPELERDVRRQMATTHRAEATWILVRDGAIVAVTGFNASTRGIVQVGGVYTPPGLRGRGYCRRVVAGSLLAARARGATRSVLFTNHDNVPAIRAYTALGYRPLGEFGLLLFE